MRIAQLVRLWRRQNRLTLRAAAGKIGIHPSTLNRLERGEQMHGATLATLLVWLMGREEPSGNEAFTFTAQDAAMGQESEDRRHQAGVTTVRIDSETKIDAGERCSLQYFDEIIPWPSAATIAEKLEAAAKPGVHALDKDASLCGLRKDGL